ncbi:MAG: hypothetical protein ACFFBD_20925 [Candidatus Hodarchaeota archaeon]
MADVLILKIGILRRLQRLDEGFNTIIQGQKNLQPLTQDHPAKVEEI